MSYQPTRSKSCMMPVTWRRPICEHSKKQSWGKGWIFGVDSPVRILQHSNRISHANSTTMLFSNFLSPMTPTFPFARHDETFEALRTYPNYPNNARSMQSVPNLEYVLLAMHTGFDPIHIGCFCTVQRKNRGVQCMWRGRSVCLAINKRGDGWLFGGRLYVGSNIGRRVEPDMIVRARRCRAARLDKNEHAGEWP